MAHPRSAAVVKIVRKLGLDVPGAFRAVQAFFDAHAKKMPPAKATDDVSGPATYKSPEDLP